MKQIDKLLQYISKLQVEEYIGLAKLLKVSLVEETNPNAEKVEERYTARDFNDVFKDTLDAFNAAPRARRREILRLLKAATSKGDEN